MGLPPSFAKAAQAASQVLAGFDLDAFRQMLESNPVAIVWDNSAAQSREGRAIIDLVVDLISRLYPEIRLGAFGSEAGSVVGVVEAQIRSINPHVALSKALKEASVIVVVGETALDPASAGHSGDIIYVGSDQWIAKLSRRGPISCGISENIYGAGAAACFAAANVFRSIFRKQLTPGGLDTDFALSLIDFEPRSNSDELCVNPSLPDSIDFGETHLVGVGAIGHGAVWAWRRTPQLSGVLHLVDPESFDETNPQRYVNIAHNATGQKAATAAGQAWISTRLRVLPHDIDWSEHVTLIGGKTDWRLDRVALALDTANDRVMVQAALPRNIHNAWTRPENLGISRHDFLEGPCVSCLYTPSEPKPNYDEVVARALGITEPLELKRVRFHLDTGVPLDESALQWIGDRLVLSNEKRDRLRDFLGCQIEELYVRGICGGVLVSVGSPEKGGQMEVPLAFQSALAGIVLAAEVVIDAGRLRSAPFPARTEINLLRPLGKRLNSFQQRPAGRSCICQDADYISAYKSKYSLS